jgi:hypothetical protein
VRRICTTKVRTTWRSRYLRLAGVLALGLALGAVTVDVASAAAPLSWSTPQSAGIGALSGVSCPSFGLCVTVGAENATVNTSPPGGGSWSAAASTGAAHALEAVSCPTTTLCVAVGDDGDVATSVNPGGDSWLAAANPASGADTDNLESVSCPTATFCIAVDADGGAIYTQNPGSGASWTHITIDSGADLVGVSCASSSLCAAVDSTGRLFLSTTPTSGAWPHQTIDSGGSLAAVSCASSGPCVAVGKDSDGDGAAWASGDPSASEPTWSSTEIDGSDTPNAISCTPEAFCLVGDSDGYLLENDSPAAASPSWSSAQPYGISVGGVSCTDAGLCAAVYGSGYALTSTLPAPTVATATGTANSQTVATLTATVNPNDAVLSSCHFNYGPTTAYGSSAPCASTPSPTGGAQTVTAQISGLTASTTYHFQIVAASDPGSSAGADATLTTPAPLKPSPALSGTAAVGDTLTCNVGTTVPAGLTVTYAWVRDTTTISGATGAQYVVAVADETHHLNCAVTISGDGGTQSASSGYDAVPSETIGMLTETSVSKASVAARSASTTVTCSPEALGHCTITMRLTLTETIRRDGVISHRTVALGSHSTEIAPGAKATVKVSLNKTGRQMLAADRRLKTTVTVSGTVVGVITGTLLKHSITFTTDPAHAKRHST